MRVCVCVWVGVRGWVYVFTLMNALTKQLATVSKINEFISCLMFNVTLDARKVVLRSIASQAKVLC